ncbi:MAG TPA: hypothetical protein VFQ36_00130 [Ktedonobacteraceae bacterium]|nr:hypothetical protein [Ktedonobacteraceae bacterium]
MVDAIIGRYRARIEETGLVLTHPSGICFDLTAGEALGLQDFIGVYRKTLLASESDTDERDTEPEIELVVIKKPSPES